MEKKARGFLSLQEIEYEKQRIVAALFCITQKYVGINQVHVMEKKHNLRPIWYNYLCRPGGSILSRVPYRDALQLLRGELKGFKGPTATQVIRELKKVKGGKVGPLARLCEVSNISQATMYRFRMGNPVKLPITRFVALAVALGFTFQIPEKKEDKADLL